MRFSDTVPASWTWGVETEVMDDAALASLLGTLDIPVSAEVQMTVYGSADEGALTVSRGDGRSLSNEYLRWCISGGCSPGTP